MIAIFTMNIANAQWQQCNGPYTGFVNCFASSSSVIFAGTSNGIYKTNNGGQSWVEISNGLIQKKIGSLAVLGTKIFAATQDSGLFVSSNMGVQWMPANNLPYKQISSIVTYNSKIYVSANGVGIYYSQDTGTTWISMNSTGLYLGISDIAINDSAIFAATYNGLYQSYDNGMTWQQSTLPMLGLQMIKIKVKGSKIAATSGNGVFISDNNGQSWNAANNDSLDYWSINPILLTDNNIYIGTIFNGLLRSSDNGVNWEHVNSGITSFNINALFIKDSVLYAGSNGGGVYKSVDNGDTWILSNQGIRNSNVYSISGSGNNIFAVNWDDGLYKSTDNGINWSKLNSSMNNKYVREIFSNTNYVFALSDKGIYRSDNLGNSWIYSNQGFDSLYPATCIIASGNNLIAGRDWGGGIFKSTNNGSNWILNASYPNIQYLHIKSFASNIDTVYALTIYGILKSTDEGMTWASIYEPDLIDYLMNDICISGNNILISKSSMIFIDNSYGWLGVSNDNGNTWTDLGITPNYPAITSMVSNSSFVFAGTSSGIYLSTNHGYNWIDVTDNIETRTINKVVINNNFLIVSTTYGAVWRRPLSDFAGFLNITSSNMLFSLFPNPATNSLTLNLSQLQKLQNATVSIYDIQGKQLLHQNIVETENQIDIRSFAKGIYIVKVQTDKETLQSKFVKE